MVDQREACREMALYIGCKGRGDMEGAREHLVELLAALDAGELIGGIVRSDIA